MAFDYLHDDYYEMSDLKQLRSETGFVINDCYEIGYYGAYGVGTDRVIDGKLDPTDMFVVYLRRYFDTGGEGRLWGGATGNGDGLLGADLWLPLGKGFALENRINYMIPKQGTGATAQPRESWGFVIQLVWYPGQNAACMKHNPFRALFNVADNSLFMVDRLAQVAARVRRACEDTHCCLTPLLFFAERRARSPPSSDSGRRPRGVPRAKGRCRRRGRTRRTRRRAGRSGSCRVARGSTSFHGPPPPFGRTIGAWA